MARIGLLLLTLAFAGASLAAQRTFVASTGVDTNPCSISAPCRSFGTAITHTDLDGEIIVLDSAGYGAVAITQSVSIIAPPGVYAGISVFGGNGVTINSPLAKVILRGLSINGQGSSNGNGIYVLAAIAVSIESCVVSEMNLFGVRIDGGTDVRIVGSIVRSSGGSGIISNAAATRLVVQDTQSERNAGTGLYVNQGGSSIVRGSRFIANGVDGIAVLKANGTMILSISDSELSGNGRHGLFVTAGPASVGVTADQVSVTRNAMNGVLLSSGGGGTLNSAFGASQIAWNGDTGIATSGVGVNHVIVSASAVNLNGSIGISATGGAVIGINGNSIARNGDFDLAQSGTAVMRTFGNNALTGSGPGEVSGTLTGVPLK